MNVYIIQIYGQQVQVLEDKKIYTHPPSYILFISIFYTIEWTLPFQQKYRL